MFGLNVLMALVWVALTGLFTLTNFVAGFVLSYLIMYLTRDAIGASNYYRKVERLSSSVTVNLREAATKPRCWVQAVPLAGLMPGARPTIEPCADPLRAGRGWAVFRRVRPKIAATPPSKPEPQPAVIPSLRPAEHLDNRPTS